jgi:hypothetical protein
MAIGFVGPRPDRRLRPVSDTIGPQAVAKTAAFNDNSAQAPDPV